MSCDGCPEKPQNTNRDRMGNIKNTESEMESYEKEELKRGNLHNNRSEYREGLEQDVTLEDYINIKKDRREKLKELGEVAVKNLTEDQRRIKVFELISIYNHDEVGMLSPTQALVALKELMQFKIYMETINGFEGLKQQIDEKYSLLLKNKIKIK